MNSLFGTARHLVLFACGVALSTTHGPAGASRHPLQHERDTTFALLDAGVHAARALDARLRSIRVVARFGGTGFVLADPRAEDEPPANGEEPGSDTPPVVSVEVHAGGDSFALGIVLVADDGMREFESGPGLQFGIGPCLFILDTGTAPGRNGLVSRFNLYGFVDGQSGLAGGIGLQGTRTTRGSTSWPP